MTRPRASVVIAAVLSLGLAVAWTVSPSARTSLRWSVRSRHYKGEVLALPAPADGYLKHIEWDGWGFPGAGNTAVYLVFDPSHALAAAAAKKKPGRLPGIPCDVYEVRQLESSWYTVLFYTDSSWDRCA